MHSPPRVALSTQLAQVAPGGDRGARLRRDQTATVREVIESLTDETQIADRPRLSR